MPRGHSARRSRRRARRVGATQLGGRHSARPRTLSHCALLRMTMQLELAISTCDRDPSYLVETLTSLFAADANASALPVRLVVCGDRADFLAPALAAVRPLHVDI